MTDGTVERIVQAIESQSAVTDALARGFEAMVEENERLWQDVAALRDDLLVLANRIEGVTRSLHGVGEQLGVDT